MQRQAVLSAGQARVVLLSWLFLPSVVKACPDLFFMVIRLFSSTGCRQGWREQIVLSGTRAAPYTLAIFWCFPCRDSFVRSVVKMFCRVLRSGFEVGPRIVLLAGSWAVSGEWRRSVRLWRWWPLTDHRVLWEGRPERSGLKAQRWWAGLLPRSPGPACHGPHARLASLPCRADWPLAASRAGGCLCQRVGQGRNMPRTRRDSPGNVLHRELPCSRCPRK